MNLNSRAPTYVISMKIDCKKISAVVKRKRIDYGLCDNDSSSNYHYLNSS